MKKRGFIVGLAVASVGFSLLGGTAFAQNASVVDDARKSVADAEKTIQEAKEGIETAKKLLATIPEDSPLMTDVVAVLKAASDSWKVAGKAIEGARASASKIDGASSEAVANDFTTLTKVNAEVAQASAGVVKIAVSFVEAASAQKAEALDIIKTALQDAVAASSQVQFRFEDIKKQITEKYSK